ncbi:MAG: hypothetical protein ACYC26_07065 [Phycisphaerales bacterium]
MIWQLVILIGIVLGVMGIGLVLEIIHTCRRLGTGAFGKDASR